MKKSHSYTLIELVVSMAIFLVMMGILFTTFSSASDIVSSEKTKLELLSDINIFYNYLTDDIDKIVIAYIDAPENNNAVLQDVEYPTGGVPVDYEENRLYFSDDSNEKTLSFYTTAQGYSHFTTANVFVRYRYVKTGSDKGKVFRDMFNYADEKDVPDALDARVTTAVILEGVRQFDFSIWQGIQGGPEVDSEDDTSAHDLTSNRKKAITDPSSMTFTVSLVSANPHMAEALKIKEQRTVIKTIYVNTLN